MKKLATYASLLILFLLVACSLQAQNATEDRYNLAVYATGFQDGQPISVSIKSIAQSTAVTKLTAEGNYQLIERSSEFLKQIEAEQQFQQSGDVADNQIAEMGASYGAQKICVISVIVEGDYLYVAARIVDVAKKISFESGEAENVSYNGVSQIRPTVASAISQILGITSATPSPGQVSNASSTPPTDKRPPNSGNTSGEKPISNVSDIGSYKMFTVNEVTFKMIFVKGGTFQREITTENNDRHFVQNVTVSDFYIGEFEVTQALWQEVMGTNIHLLRAINGHGGGLYGSGANYPIYYVNHEDAKAFCERLNQRLQLPYGYSFALPTEAEWEYAARGGNKTKDYYYSGSNNISDVGWCLDNSNNSTHIVGSKKANELGLYDMSGNVWEWCSDWYGSFSELNLTDPQGPYSGKHYVMRSGGWNHNPSYCKVSFRGHNYPDYGDMATGFRLALVRR